METLSSFKIKKYHKKRGEKMEDNRRYYYKHISDDEADDLIRQGMTFEELESLDWGYEYELQKKQKEEEEK